MVWVLCCFVLVCLFFLKKHILFLEGKEYRSRCQENKNQNVTVHCLILPRDGNKTSHMRCFSCKICLNNYAVESKAKNKPYTCLEA